MSLIIKIGQNGSSKEYLFDSLGPITIGSDQRCDLWLDDPRLEPKFLEIKVSGGIVFIKEIGARSQIYLDSVILPYRQEVPYHEGGCISFKDSKSLGTCSRTPKLTTRSNSRSLNGNIHGSDNGTIFSALSSTIGVY